MAPRIVSIGGALRTVLVVDDDAKVPAIVQKVLTRHGFQVLIADSPSEAFAIVTRSRVHLIISDVHMPGLPGPELLAFLRKRGIDAPVLFMSGDLRVATAERSLAVPGASFLPKPFGVAELLGAVTTILGSVN
jgi:DNA-binding NtrC family response regulator